MTQIAKLSVAVLAGADDQVVVHGLDRAPDWYFLVQPGEAEIKAALKTVSLAAVGAAIGTTKTKVKTVAASVHVVDNVFYTTALTDDFWTLTGFDCTNALYNKCLLCIDSAGAMQIGEGTEAATAAGVVLPDLPADSAVVAILQVNPTGTGNFVGGTTDLDDGTVVPNATFTDVLTHPDVFGTVSFGTTPDATNIYLSNSMNRARNVVVVAAALHSIIE